MKPTRILFCLMAAALAAGCSSDDDSKDKPFVPTMCPQVAILRPLEIVNDYAGEQPSTGELVASAHMDSIDGDCEYRKKGGVDVHFTLAMGAVKGPRLGGSQASFPYFVSIVSPDNKPVAKELMTANFTFKSGKKTAADSEDLHVFIPLPKHGDGSDYRVLAGFQLTEDQLKETGADKPVSDH